MEELTVVEVAMLRAYCVNDYENADRLLDGSEEMDVYVKNKKIELNNLIYKLGNILKGEVVD